jgi:hypothetical protein
VNFTVKALLCTAPCFASNFSPELIDFMILNLACSDLRWIAGRIGVAISYPNTPGGTPVQKFKVQINTAAGSNRSSRSTASLGSNRLTAQGQLGQNWRYSTGFARALTRDVVEMRDRTKP